MKLSDRVPQGRIVTRARAQARGRWAQCLRCCGKHGIVAMVAGFAEHRQVAGYGFCDAQCALHSRASMATGLAWAAGALPALADKALDSA